METKKIEADLFQVVEEIFPQQTGLETDNEQEYQLTLRYVFKHQRALFGWSFFWSMCAIGWGFDVQVNGAMVSIPAFRKDFGYEYNNEYVIPASWLTAFNVLSSPGQLIGGFLCSYLADRFGRRNALLAGLLFCTGGTVGQLVATTRGAFLGSKIVLGLGLGFYLTLGPMVTSEITPVVLRGIATAGVNLGIAVGQLLSNSVIAGFGNRSDRWAYRGPFAFQLVFALVLFVGFFYAPESPGYLVKSGKSEQATNALKSLWGPNVDIQAKLAALEITIACESLSKGELSILDCFKGTNLLRTMISMGVFVCQHAVGIVFVLGYSSYFFQLAGLNTTNSFALGIGVTACGVTGNLLSWFVINNIGRRKVFVYGMATLTAMLFLIAIVDFIHTSVAKWVQAATTVIWAFVYSFSIGAMAFAILGETSSSYLRAPTAALATATQAVMGMVMNFFIPYMINPDEGNLHGKVGFVFGGLGLIGTIWSYLFIPELNGRTFHDIDQMFFDRVPPRKMGNHRIRR